MSLLLQFIDKQFIHKSPPTPTASFKDKTIIVTGSNVGLGLEAVKLLVRLGASQVILACRSIEKGKIAAKDIETTTSCSPDMLHVWELDMSSYASVQAFAERVKTELPCLDALIGNAGILTSKFRMTEDNEESLTTNVVSLYLLAFLLYPKLQETAERFSTETHFTVTASELYEAAKFNESQAPTGQIFATLNDEKTANMSDRYNVTKLIVVLMTKELAALYPLSSSKVIVNCVAPGMCVSQLGREVSKDLGPVVTSLVNKIARPTEVGARTIVHGASAGSESHGQYVPDCKIMPTAGLAKGERGTELQRRVWLELKQKLEAIRSGVTSFA